MNLSCVVTLTVSFLFSDIFFLIIISLSFSLKNSLEHLFFLKGQGEGEGGREGEMDLLY